MKIGYGHPGDEAALTAWGAEKLYIDAPKGDRVQRQKMLDVKGVRKGDTLGMVSRGRLGIGRAVPALCDKLTLRGVQIEDVAPIPVANGNPGRRPIFDPTPEQDAQIEPLWHSAYGMSYVLREATRIMGFEIKRWHLSHRYGPAREI